MKSTIIVAVVLASATSALGALLKAPSSGDFELLILHNNDMHARFEQTSQLSGACTTADREAGKCYGGFPRVAHVVKEARRAAQSGEGPPVLYLNAGDTYTGTAWFTIYKWKIAAEFINALQPDAVSLGNNEIEKGTEKLSPLLNNINTKILVSNIILKSATNNDNLKKSIIFDIQGQKVGIVGYLTLDTSILDFEGDIEYIDEVIALNEEVAKLQAEDVKIIIALGHSTLDKDMEIAKEVNGLDLIISGQRNKFYWDGCTLDDTPHNPIIVTQASGRQVSIVQSSSYNKYLGSLLTTFDSNGEITKFNSDPVLLSPTILQDEEALQIVRTHYADINSRSEEVIGNTAVVLDGNTCKNAECNLGNLITDAIMYYYAVRYEGERYTDAPLAVIHGGAIAASIAPTNRPAPVTRGDLLSALPLESNLVVVTMSGDILKEVLEHSVSNYSSQNPTGQLLQFSGIRAVYDLSREPGSRLVDVVVRCWECFVPEFFGIDDWRSYKVLMPAALADGEFGYSMLVGLERQTLAYDEVTCLAEYIGLRTPVYPEVAGRIILNNEAEEDVGGEEDGEDGGEDGGEESGEDGGEDNGEEEVEGVGDGASSITANIIMITAMIYLSLRN